MVQLFISGANINDAVTICSCLIAAKSKVAPSTPKAVPGTHGRDSWPVLNKVLVDSPRTTIVEHDILF